MERKWSSFPWKVFAQRKCSQGKWEWRLGMEWNDCWHDRVEMLIFIPSIAEKAHYGHKKKKRRRPKKEQKVYQGSATKRISCYYIHITYTDTCIHAFIHLWLFSGKFLGSSSFMNLYNIHFSFFPLSTSVHIAWASYDNLCLFLCTI